MLFYIKKKITIFLQNLDKFSFLQDNIVDTR